MSDAIVLAQGAARARVLARAGGRMTALTLVRADGRPVPVLHRYPEDHRDPVRWAKGGIYPLAPFSNRIAHARVRMDDGDVDLQPHPDAWPHALHGRSHLQAWQVLDASASEVRMRLDAPASAAWPWQHRAELHYRLEPDVLHVRIALVNRDARPMPAGIGLHPYLCHEPGALVAFDPAHIWDQDADGLATARRAARGDERLAPARALPAGGLTWYASGWSGQAGAALPGAAWLQLDADPVFGHLVVHRPDHSAYLCLEPVSHVTDGFNLAARGVEGTGAVRLAPGEQLAGSVRLRLAEAAPC